MKQLRASLTLIPMLSANHPLPSCSGKNKLFHLQMDIKGCLLVSGDMSLCKVTSNVVLGCVFDYVESVKQTMELEPVSFILASMMIFPTWIETALALTNGCRDHDR